MNSSLPLVTCFTVRTGRAGAVKRKRPGQDSRGDEGQANVSVGRTNKPGFAHEGRLQYYLGRDLVAAAQAPWSHHWLDHAAWLMSLAATRQPVCVCVCGSTMGEGAMSCWSRKRRREGGRRPTSSVCGTPEPGVTLRARSWPAMRRASARGALPSTRPSRRTGRAS